MFTHKRWLRHYGMTRPIKLRRWVDWLARLMSGYPQRHMGFPTRNKREGLQALLERALAMGAWLEVFSQRASKTAGDARKREEPDRVARAHALMEDATSMLVGTRRVIDEVKLGLAIYAPKKA
jgi:hypothetical protein